MSLAMFALLPIVVHVIFAQSPECPVSRSPSQLAAVTVWTRRSNGSDVYRISDEDLTDEGFQRASNDRKDVVVLLARSPGACTFGPCTLQLSTNIRQSDGAISHQENVFGIPYGFTDTNNSFYCARRMGDCGAQQPIFRYTRGYGESLVYAYSLDPLATFPGYSRDPKVLCYGWADSGSVIRPVSDDKNCLAVNAIANGRVTYSTAASSFYSVGTTATLTCDDGYVGGGQSTVMCVKSGWYPTGGLGYCVRKNETRLNHGSSAAVSSAALECAALGTIANGHLIYNTLAIGGRFVKGTRATVLCNLGFHVFGSADAICEDGRWSRKVGTCQSNFSPKCPSINVPLPGRVTYSSLAPYVPPTSATLTCDLGLVVSGVSSLVCTEDGWLPPTGFGACRAATRTKRQATTGATCPAANVDGGITMYIQSNVAIPYSTGTTVFVMCNLGNALQGSTSAMCQNGVWTPALGTCRSSSMTSTPATALNDPGVNSGSAGSQCLAMAVPANGLVSYSPNGTGGSYTTGTVATLSCNLGFTISGSLSSTCSAGTWIPAVLGTCNQGLGGLGSNSIDSCPNPTVTNGMITYSTGSVFDTTRPSGTTATLSCNFGFTLTGSSTSSCFSGVWNPKIGNCTSSSSTGGGLSQQCPYMLPPFGSTIAYSIAVTTGPFNSGTTATVRCNNGAAPQGLSVSTCTDGQWTPPSLGICSLGTGTGGIGTTCSAMFPPFGGTLSYSTGGSFGPFSSGTTVTLTCTNGVVSGASSATCYNGQWSPTTMGTCSTTGIGGTGGTCSALFQPFGGILTYSTGSSTGPFASGSTVTLSCLGGFPMGSSFATCSNGQWSPPALGTCSTTGGTGGTGGVTCPALPTPWSGTLSYSTGSTMGPFSSGTSVTLTCTSGFVTGSSYATCSNGQWSPSTLGTCSSTGGSTGGLTCFALFPPIGGTLSYSTGSSTGPFNSGTTVTVSCSSGFVTGSPYATCSNGQWSPSTLGTCSTTGTGTGVGTTCYAMTKPTGSTLSYSNGRDVDPFPSGTTVTMNCLSGTPLGSTRSTCSSGQWYPPSLGTCSSIIGGNVGSTCPVLTAPSGGTITFSSGFQGSPAISGTSATLSCPSGVQGASTTYCTNGVWTPATLGTCIGFGGIGGATTTCQAMTTPSGVYLSYSNMATTPPFPSGTTVTARCTSGAAVTGSSIATCLSGAWFPATLGTCGLTSNDPGSTCSNIQAVGGTIDYSDGDFLLSHSPGSTASLLCTGGAPIGSALATCLNGQWTPTIGTCSTGGLGGTAGTGTSCTMAPVAPFGVMISYSSGGIFGPWTSGSLATMTCPTGQTVIGSATATCNNGLWTALGSCSAAGQSGSSSWLTQAANTSTTPIPCYFGLIEPMNGSISYTDTVPPYSYGSMATLTCNGGYQVKGSATATCTNGSFTAIGSCAVVGSTS
ncbi:hypothetical protein Q1695_010284 [Nippostrongylus brasiliensis]|nr:hypothetical protein Q1695_010284 [Nippostrongylus brasiliensis]